MSHTKSKGPNPCDNSKKIHNNIFISGNIKLMRTYRLLNLMVMNEHSVHTPRTIEISIVDVNSVKQWQLSESKYLMFSFEIKKKHMKKV